MNYIEPHNNPEIMTKLTLRQRQVVKAVQNGAMLITHQDCPGAVISGGNEIEDWEIGSQVFWNLVNKGFVVQMNVWPFNYILTNDGETIKL